MNIVVSLVVSIIGLAAFFVMLNVKSEVQILQAERIQLLQEQKRLREDYKVLQAEYAHLTRPERLNQFAARAGMEDLATYQILPMSAATFLESRHGS